MDPFTNASHGYQRAKGLRATPFPLQAGEVFEYADPSIFNLVRHLIGIALFAVIAFSVIGFFGGGHG